MKRPKKSELRDKLAQDINSFLEYGYIEKVNPPSKRKRNKSARKPPKQLWRAPSLKTQTTTDPSSVSTDLVPTSTKAIVCSTPGQARQAAAKFADAGIPVQVRNCTVIIRASKAKQKAKAEATLQQLLSD